jgi:hypothetical protein
VRTALEATPGVAQVLGKMEKHLHGLNHERSGDLIAIADAKSWFTYYYWQDDRKAPDFARCVDIHRKCGYDPAELFLDPSSNGPSSRSPASSPRKPSASACSWTSSRSMPSLVKGSHGRIPEDRSDWPVLIGDFDLLPRTGILAAHEVCNHLFRLCSSGHGYGNVGL